MTDKPQSPPDPAASESHAEPTAGRARYLITAEEIRAATEAFSHPWNENSRLIGAHLSALAGLRRAGVSLVRIPTGRESFCHHVHHGEEEWVYILAGHGTADIGERSHPVAPGDFLAFHASGEAHHLRNTGAEDLVYLMGGEHRDSDVVDFPRLGRRMVRLGTDVEIHDRADARPFDAEAPRRRR
jgi:uncharacterized cupin superfamily protein